MQGARTAPPVEVSGINAVTVSGELLERSAQRSTPAGLPAQDVVLRHRSVVQDQGVARLVQWDCRAVGLGEMAVQLQRLSLGQPASFRGYLAAGRNGKGLVFHITRIDPTSDAQPD